MVNIVYFWASSSLLIVSDINDMSTLVGNFVSSPRERE